jgi:hypothetical protein
MHRGAAPGQLPWQNPAVGPAFTKAVRESSAETLLLSSEAFAFASVDRWKKLVELCTGLGLDLHLIAGVRNQCDWLSSSYMQLVKRNHMTADPETYLRKEYRRMALLKYDSYFGRLASEVTNRISFLSYDLATKANDLIPRFMSILGVNDLSRFSDVTTRLNLAPPPEEIAFLRQCNIHGSSANFSDVLAEAAPDSSPDQPVPPWTVVNPALASEITSYFEPSRASFLSAFNLEPTFFQAPCDNFIDLNKLKIDTAVLVSIVARYLVAFEQRLNRAAAAPPAEPRSGGG